MDRPFVYVNMAMTADGKITSAGREYPRFTSPFDRRNMDRLRAEADAIMVGARTLRADDPSLHVRDPEMQAYRRSLGKPADLLAIVVSRSLDLDPNSRCFSSPGTAQIIVATVEAAPADRVAMLAGRAEVWRIGRDEVDLGELLRRLAARGVERLLVEGGGELNASLLRDDRIDELYVTIAPALLGGRDAPTPIEGAGLKMEQRVRLRLADVQREGDELYCRWVVLR